MRTGKHPCNGIAMKRQNPNKEQIRKIQDMFASKPFQRKMITTCNLFQFLLINNRKHSYNTQRKFKEGTGLGTTRPT